MRTTWRWPRYSDATRIRWDRLLTDAAFLYDFAGDLLESKAKVLYAVQEPFHKALLTGKTTQVALAFEAELLRGFHRRSHNKTRSGALHGQADECNYARSEIKPSFTDFPSQ